MNVEQLCRLHRDEAFAKQFTAPDYSTFVAMPFGKTDKYDADEVYHQLKEQVYLRANELRAAANLPKPFAKLQRVSEHKGTAIVVTESIATRILEDHFFVGDLTGNNAGAVLETGVALALKPNQRLVLVTQDNHRELHFDVRDTNVIGCTLANLVEQVAQALVEAAVHFESEARAYITQVSACLTSDAILLLSRYGSLWKNRHSGSAPSLWEHPDSCGARFGGADGRLHFQQAIRELLQKRLAWTDYNASPGGDAYGAHATKLGQRVIEHIWRDNAMMNELKDAPTGPNKP